MFYLLLLLLLLFMYLFYLSIIFFFFFYFFLGGGGEGGCELTSSTQGAHLLGSKYFCPPSQDIVTIARCLPNNVALWCQVICL